MKIEKGVPLVDARTGANCARTKYPWSEMEIGDSFFAPVSSNSLRTTAAHHAKKTGWQFKVRKEAHGARAWRVK